MRGGISYIALAIPGFMAFIAIELAYVRLKRKDYYHLDDTVADLGCGVLQQISGFFLRGFLGLGYLFVHEHVRLFAIPDDSVWAWIAVWVGVDFCYYWFHRKSHEVNFLWAAHVVHHQSEEYNLAVALRQSALQPCFSWVFYLPLALIGFPPLMFFTAISLNTLYQFWIHTRAVGKLGPFEWIFNTPSHHRVHHGRNAEYIDRNHAGSLIVWDKLFGTFQPEGPEPVYGITRPLSSFNPLYANVATFKEIIADARRLKGFDKVRIWFARPGWLPDYAHRPQGRPLDAPRYATEASRAGAVYVLVQFLPIIPATMGFLILARGGDRSLTVLFAVLIGLTAVTLPGLLEARAWAKPAELFRLSLLGLAAVLAVKSGLLQTPLPAGALVASALGSVAWLVWRSPKWTPSRAS